MRGAGAYQIFTCSKIENRGRQGDCRLCRKVSTILRISEKNLINSYLQCYLLQEKFNHFLSLNVHFAARKHSLKSELPKFQRVTEHLLQSQEWAIGDRLKFIFE